jgi:hypothetical protein
LSNRIFLYFNKKKEDRKRTRYSFSIFFQDLKQRVYIESSIPPFFSRNKSMENENEVEFTSKGYKMVLKEDYLHLLYTPSDSENSKIHILSKLSIIDSKQSFEYDYGTLFLMKEKIMEKGVVDLEKIEIIRQPQGWNGVWKALTDEEIEYNKNTMQTKEVVKKYYDVVAILPFKGPLEEIIEIPYGFIHFKMHQNGDTKYELRSMTIELLDITFVLRLRTITESRFNYGPYSIRVLVEGG